MKRVLVLLVLCFVPISVIFAGDNSTDLARADANQNVEGAKYLDKDMAPNFDQKITKEFHPMPPGPGPGPYPYPYPNPGPNNDRELCLAEGYLYNNASRVFYAFGERRHMAIRRALQKCQNSGFYNCRVGWCGEVY